MRSSCSWSSDVTPDRGACRGSAQVLWRKHARRIASPIADVLTSLGLTVVHIRDASMAEVHQLAPPARLVRGRLTYAPDRSAESV